MVGHMPLEHGILVRAQVPQPARATLKSRRRNVFLALHRAMGLGIEPTTKVSRKFPLVRLQVWQQKVVISLEVSHLLLLLNIVNTTESVRSSRTIYLFFLYKEVIICF